MVAIDEDVVRRAERRPEKGNERKAPLGHEAEPHRNGHQQDPDVHPREVVGGENVRLARLEVLEPDGLHPDPVDTDQVLGPLAGHPVVDAARLIGDAAIPGAR